MADGTDRQESATARIRRWTHSPRVRSRLGWAALIGALAFIFGPTFVRHVRYSADPLWFHDDVRIHIWPYFRYTNPAAFDRDYLGAYAIDAFMPVGFHVFYGLTAWLWDPEPMSKVLPYVLLALTAWPIARAVHPFGGKVAAFTALGLLFGSSLFLDRMGGGMSRAFAYPAIAGCLAALVAGRTGWAAAMVWVGAAFYPMAGVVMGAGLTAALTLLPADGLGRLEGRPFADRLKYLGAVAGVSAVLLAPLAWSQRAHGPMVSHLDVSRYPEAGPAGTVSRRDLPPFATLTEEVVFVAPEVVFGAGKPWTAWGRTQVNGPAERKNVLEILFAVLLIGLWPVAQADLRMRRLLAFGLGIGLAHGLARLVAPYAYTPSRYVYYGLPPLLLILIPAALGGLGLWSRRLGAPRWAGPGVQVAGCALLLAVVGGRGGERAGLTVHVEPDQAAIYDAIAQLPPGVMIGGWPDDEMSNVPYVARRQAFMTGEMHMPHHAGHLNEVRRRLRPLFEAYLARDPEPLRRLRDTFGVTHLLVNLSRLQGHPPLYMPPMRGWIRQIHRDWDGHSPYVLQAALDSDAMVARVGRWVLYDLSGF